AQVGDHELQQQVTAEIAGMGDGYRQPSTQLRPPGARGGEDRAVAAGDPGLLPDRMHVATDLELLQRAVGEGARQRPDAADVALGLEARRERESMGGPGVQDAEAGPLARQQLVLTGA